MINIFIDFGVIVLSIVFSIVFLALHILVIRSIGDRAVFPWLLRVFFLVAVVGIAPMILFFQNIPSEVIVLLTLATVTLYALIVFSYILGIFGITITSVRIQILCKIFSAGSRGITTKELMKDYNRTVQFSQRLHRLITSGEVKEKNGKYFVPRSLSPFILHMKMQELFRRLYNG